jgi:hypothetical protein
MIVHSQASYAAILAHVEGMHGRPPPRRRQFSFPQSTHLWTESDNAIAAREISRYDRA